MKVDNLLHGDCLEILDSLIKKNIKVNAIITDPPYGTTACKWDNVLSFNILWDKLNKIILPNSPILLFGIEPFSSYLRLSNIKNYKYDLIWNKVLHSNPFLAKKQPLTAHELISVFYKKQPVYNPQMEKGDKSLFREGNNSHYTDTKGNSKLIISTNKSGKRYPKKIITIPNTNRNGYHPTEKPVKLMEYLINTFTNSGDLVLDFTMGSGSTGVACKNTNRKFIGIELDTNYFNIAKNRIYGV